MRVTVTVSGQSLTIEKPVRAARDAERVELRSAAAESPQATGSRSVS